MDVEPMTLDKLRDWHSKQANRRDIDKETMMFHLRAMTLLGGIGNAIDTLSRTRQGE